MNRYRLSFIALSTVGISFGVVAASILAVEQGAAWGNPTALKLEAKWQSAACDLIGTPQNPTPWCAFIYKQQAKLNAGQPIGIN